MTTPLLRVTPTEHGHHYHRSLYDPMADRVHDVPFPREWAGTPERAAGFIDQVSELPGPRAEAESARLLARLRVMR